MNLLRRVGWMTGCHRLAFAALASASPAWAEHYNVPVSPAATVVGHVRDYRQEEKGVVDAFVILGEQKGLATGYSDLKSAKDAAIALPGIEAIHGTRTLKLYAVRLIDNTPENVARLAQGDLATLTEDPPAVLAYRTLKCVMKSELLLDQPPKGEPRAVNVVDDQGLFLASYRMKEAARGSKLMRMTVDWELTNGNFQEAKEVYLYLEELNAKIPDLEIVQVMARTNLRKFVQSRSPELAAFAESEMRRRGYSEALMADLRGKP